MTDRQCVFIQSAATDGGRLSCGVRSCGSWRDFALPVLSHFTDNQRITLPSAGKNKGIWKETLGSRPPCSEWLPFPLAPVRRNWTYNRHWIMLVSTVDGDLCPPVEEPVATAYPKASKKKDKAKEKKFIWNHGITPPLKNVRKRRFRKTIKKKYIESPDVEEEVKRLLRADAEAVSTRWEIITEDETKEAENQGLDISSPGMSGHRQGHASLEHDELREIFNDLSSSSEDEDETQHQDEEDINIMDTEEDLERQLQDKLNESDEHQQENEGTNQLVMGIQKQIDNMKGKLQETQDRAKRQEDLILKVENLALKNRFQAVLDELKQKEEREKEQLSSLQEELESLLEK
ncbi:transcription initiation factor TFIID subunit 7-like [Mesoplodon densirostris]|uniref:transcription initiation factor TFIID subunit 7-like n=1 Tax=Mesoplodon densirostris TaxID=48708 RepID=UPI0028DBC083|nr:transcription initiation factor TFIID subunit 7-like [Mesoplodon densirostris]